MPQPAVSKPATTTKRDVDSSTSAGSNATGRGSLQDHLGDVVSLDLGGAGDRLQLLRVEHAEHGLELHGHAGGAHAQHVAPPAHERRRRHPEDVGAQAGGHQRRGLVGADHQLARLGVHLRVERQAGGLPGVRFVRPGPGEGLDGPDRRALARRQEDDLVAGPDAAALDGAHEDAPVVAGGGELVHVLERHAERPVEVVVEALEVLDLLEHGGAVVPRRLGGARDDVGAVAGAHRDEAGRPHAEARRGSRRTRA